MPLRFYDPAIDRTESLHGDYWVSKSYLEKYGGNLPYLIYFPQTNKAARMRITKNFMGKTANKRPIRNLRNIKF